MKKTRLLLISLVLLIIMIPVVFAKDEVSIESYKLVGHSDTTTELSKPKVDGLNISFDLSFTQLKDYAEYQIIINNPTNDYYIVNKDSEFESSEYVAYNYEFDGNSNIVQAKSKLTMYITITYSNQVPEDKLTNDKFIENNKMAISLSTDTSSASKEENPKTSIMISITSVIILAIVGILLTLYISTKQKKYLNTLIIGLLLLPITIYAIDILQIKVETKITIEKAYKLTYYTHRSVKKSEKSNYTMPSFIPEEQRCDTTIYKINGEEYISCYVIAKTSLHKSGERIEVTDIPTASIRTYRYNDQGTQISTCTHNEAMTIFDCDETALVNVNLKEMDYIKRVNADYKENDMEVMNFNDIRTDEWNSEYGYAYFSSPNAFTMPAHDVVIYAHEPYL